MKKTFKQLCKLAEKLRSPKGCPWDKEQTIKSMLAGIKEETEEVAQAIENGDNKNLQEELGDVIFQVVMIAQIAKEEGYFDMEEVLESIYDKIVSRHTWVFGKDKAKTAEEVIKIWNRNKRKEKNNK